jgi:hypothetical protein
MALPTGPDGYDAERRGPARGPKHTSHRTSDDARRVDTRFLDGGRRTTGLAGRRRDLAPRAGRAASVWLRSRCPSIRLADEGRTRIAAPHGDAEESRPVWPDDESTPLLWRTKQGRHWLGAPPGRSRSGPHPPLCRTALGSHYSGSYSRGSRTLRLTGRTATSKLVEGLSAPSSELSIVLQDRAVKGSTGSHETSSLIGFLCDNADFRPVFPMAPLGGQVGL